MRLRPTCAAAVLAAGATLALAPAAPAATLQHGIYDCYGYNYATGFSDYKGSVKLKGGGRYEHTFGRDGKRFDDKTTGRYRIRGRKVIFKGGAMALTPGKVDKTEPGDEPSFAVWVDGEPSGVTCTHDATP